MLGRYENFPNIAHGIASLASKASRRELQEAIISTFYRLNHGKWHLKEIAYCSTPSCEVVFELGVAENVTFIYLDDDEFSTLKSKVSQRAPGVLDFLCILKYHLRSGSKKGAALRFDYFMLRFVFSGRGAKLFVSHERGPQHVYAEDLIAFLMRCVRDKLGLLLSKHSSAGKQNKKLSSR